MTVGVQRRNHNKILVARFAQENGFSFPQEIAKIPGETHIDIPLKVTVFQEISQMVSVLIGVGNRVAEKSMSHSKLVFRFVCILCDKNL